MNIIKKHETGPRFYSIKPTATINRKQTCRYLKTPRKEDSSEVDTVMCPEEVPTAPKELVDSEDAHLHLALAPTT